MKSVDAHDLLCAHACCTCACDVYDIIHAAHVAAALETSTDRHKHVPVTPFQCLMTDIVQMRQNQVSSHSMQPFCRTGHCPAGQVLMRRDPSGKFWKVDIVAVKRLAKGLHAHEHQPE